MTDNALELERLFEETRLALSAGQLSVAAESLEKARDLTTRPNDHAELVDLFGAILANAGRLGAALDHHILAAKLVREQCEWDGMITRSQIPGEDVGSREPVIEARYLGNVGSLAQVADAPAVAEAALNRALMLLDREGPKKLLSEIAHNMGVFLMNIGRADEAIPQLERCLRLDRSTGDKHSVALDLLRLAAAYRRKGDAKGALKCAKEALEAALLVGTNEAVDARLEISAIHFATGDLIEAMSATREAIDELEAISESSRDTARSFRLGRAYADMGLYARTLGRRKAALEALNRAAEHAKLADSPALRAMIAREIVKLNEVGAEDDGDDQGDQGAE